MTMTSGELKHALAAIVRGEVLDNPQELARVSRDTSIFEVRPKLLVRPKDADDVSAVVRYVREKKDAGEDIALAGRSAGTDMTGGPLTEGIVLEYTPHMNTLRELGDGYAIVEPGMYYRDFEKAVRARGLLMPSYTASKDLCAVGGMVNNNSGGEKTLTYGKTENYVESVRVVLSDGSQCEFRKLSREELEEKKRLSTMEGEIYRRMHELIEKNYELLKRAKPNVTKNSAGYALWNVYDRDAGTFDLSKLIVGSQGTLAQLTEIRFRLIHPKPHARLVVIFLNEVRTVAEVIHRVLKFKPESLESYDDHTLRFAVRLFPMIMKRMKGSAISLGFRFFPEFKAVLTGGVPKLILLAEFTGETEDEARKKAKIAADALRKDGYNARLTASEQEAEKYWVMRRESFNLLRQKMEHVRTAAFIEDFAVHPDDLPKFLPELYEILDRYPLTYTTAGHMGDANFHIIPLMDMSDPKAQPMIVEIMDQVYDLILKYKGTITAEHNDGLIRSRFLPKMYGEEVYRLFEETKHIFDPANIMNPGKKVGASLEYALAHMVKGND
jgi:FAD/FMN-containing dehydrogenase